MELFESGTLSNDKKTQLIDQYPSLTEKDFEEDNHEKLLVHLQQKLGKSKDEMRKIIRNME